MQSLGELFKHAFFYWLHCLDYYFIILLGLINWRVHVTLRNKTLLCFFGGTSVDAGTKSYD